MTAGQLLTSLSGMPSGTAAAHLLGITAGSGTGETIYAPRFSVLIAEPRLTVSRKPARVASEAAQKLPAPSTSKQRKNIYVMGRPQELSVVTQADELWVVVSSFSFQS